MNQTQTIRKQMLLDEAQKTKDFFAVKSIAQKISSNALPVSTLLNMAKGTDAYETIQKICDEHSAMVTPIVISTTEMRFAFLSVEDAATYLVTEYQKEDITLGEFLIDYSIEADMDDAEDLIFELRHRIDGWPTKAELHRCC